MKRAVVVSMSPNIGHLSHVVAYYKLFKDLGYDSVICVDEKVRGFLPDNMDILTRIPHDNISLALFYSPHITNPLEILKYRFGGNCRVIYVYHEPLLSFSSFLKAGFSFGHVCRIYIEDFVEKLCVIVSNNVLLPSQKALSNYESGINKYLNSSYSYFPLIFDDIKQNEFTDRKYFSYIGTVAEDHAFEEFLNFACHIIEHNKLPQLRILIATSSEFDVPETLNKSERVKIQKGRYLTNEEIDSYFSSTKVLWNAYNRMTQSGVLAKAFMFGTPAIMMRHNLNEFAHDNEEVIALDDNKSFDQLEKALDIVMNSFEVLSKKCRQRFLKTFYYKSHIIDFKKIISQ